MKRPVHLVIGALCLLLVTLGTGALLLRGPVQGKPREGSDRDRKAATSGDNRTPAEDSAHPSKSSRQPSSRVSARALLAAQDVGGRLLGNTVKLVDGEFVATDLDYAPRHYFFFYSASW